MLSRETGKTAFWSGLLLMIGLPLVVIALTLRSYFAPATAKFEFAGPTITQLEKLGDLVTCKIHVADVLTSVEGAYKGSWLIKGDALIAVDLKQAKLVEKQMDRKHAIISLPPPRVIHARVDHTKTKTWSVERTTFLPAGTPILGAGGDPDELRDSAMAQAQLDVEHTAQQPEALDQSRETTSQIITTMYRMLDWDVEVSWQDREPLTP